MNSEQQITAQQLLDQILKSGKELFEQGKEMASKGVEYAKEGVEQAKDQLSEKLSDYVEIPPPGPERDELMKKIGATAAVGGILALLVGTKSGRKILGPIIKVGSVAALGAIGLKAYEKWREQDGIEVEGQSIANLEGPAAKERSVAILRAMVAAAKADGAISKEEEQMVSDHIKTSGLEDDSAAILMNEMSNPSSANDIANLSDSPIMGVDLYLSSLAVAGLDNDADKSYLAELAKLLKLDTGLVDEIHNEAGFAVQS